MPTELALIRRHLVSVTLDDVPPCGHGSRHVGILDLSRASIPSESTLASHIPSLNNSATKTVIARLPGFEPGLLDLEPSLIAI